MLQNDVGEAAGLDVRIYWELAIVDGAEPNFMVTLARSIVSAPMPPEDYLDEASIARHLGGDGQSEPILSMIMDHNFDRFIRIDFDVIQLDHLRNQYREFGS